ncbi:sugar porter family MFS transporter [Catenovulum maritimum]|uniref:Sugar transporter n=1 Tax=Catenovulum maritimum TaxID=1513271 RepID=A0A0J8GV87_9ALTE|nr:sugar porter family MFS transporter [Catenovulum maritimum]KMT66700.1 sugar transporter [Catenovulum maritimum]
MYQSNRNALLYAFIVSIGGFIFGLDIMLISGTFQYTGIEFGLSALEKGNIAAAPNYGALVALLLAGYFCDKFGRKKTLMIIAALYTISAVGSAFATSYFELFAARLIGGLAFTSLSLASMYIGEIAPPKMRGKLVGLNQLNIVIGILAATILNYYLVDLVSTGSALASSIGMDDKNVWRWMLGLEILPAILWFGLLFLIPESPRWLMLNHSEEKAHSVIAKLVPPKEVESQFKQIVDSLKSTEHSLSYMEQMKALFSKSMRMALVIGVLMAAIQALSGMNAILAFMPMIFQQVGGGESAFLQSIWVSSIGALFTVLGLLLIDKLGRRKILLGGLVTCAASMLLVTYGFYDATYVIPLDGLAQLSATIDTSLLKPLAGVIYQTDTEFKQAVIAAIGQADFVKVENDLLLMATNMQGMLVLAGIITFVCAYNFSLGPILWILFSEIFPTKVRAVAITSSALVATIFGGIVVPTFFPWQLENLGATNTFLAYAVFCIIGFVIMAKIAPETKGKTIEEIEDLLAGKSNSKEKSGSVAESQTSNFETKPLNMETSK